MKNSQKEVEKQALKNEILRNHPTLSEDSLSERELTLAEVKAMPAREYYWHSIYNSKNVELALSEQSRKQAGQEQLQKNNFRQFWNDAPEDTKKRVQIAGQVGYEFQNLYPQFVSCEENTTQIVNFIKDSGEVFSLGAVIRAYQNLCARGLIWVTPENAGLEGSEAVRGRLLTNRPDFYKLLEPVKVLSDSEKEQQRVAGLSADEYAAEFLQKDELPPIIQRRIESDIREFCLNHPTYDPSPEGKEILLSWIRRQGLHVCHDSLEASWLANQEKLHAANCIFDSGPSIPVRYNASILVDHRKPHIPEIERSVVIREPESAKRFSMADILSWDSATMVKMMQLYPDLQKQIDNM